MDKIEKVFGQSFGKACFASYFFLLMFHTINDLVINHLIWVAILGCLFVLALALSSQLADLLDAIGPARLAIVASTSCSLSAALFYFSFIPALLIVGGLCALIGCVIFFLILGKNVSFYSHENRLRQISSCFIATGLIVSVASPLSGEAFLVVLFVLPIFSAFHLIALKPQKDSFEFANIKESRKNHRFQFSTLTATFMTGVVCGIAFFFVARPANSITFNILFFSIPLIVSGTLFYVGGIKNNRLNENFLLRCFATVTFLTIAPMPFVSEQAQQILGGLLFLIFSADNVICFSAMGEVARFNQLSPYWVFGKSLAYFFAGALAAFFSFLCVFSQNAMIPELIACYITLFVFILCCDFLFQDSYPAEDPITDGTVINEHNVQTDSYPTLWRRKISSVINQYELTPRQQEVFRMLVKGRNAQYIANNFVISISTAKAHIHNIYRKLDVHSQQELINLVENATPQDDDVDNAE